MQLYKKCSTFLGLLLISAQLQALPVDPAPAPLALPALPFDCPGLPADIASDSYQRLLDFYLQRGMQGAWISSAQLQQLASQLEQLADDGLNPDNYQLQAILQRVALPAMTGQTADCADIRATQAYLQALHDLSRGRLQQNLIEPLWYSELTPPTSPFAPLTPNQRDLGDLQLAFDEARPNVAQYQLLRNSYALMRQRELPNWPLIDSGPLIKPGMSDLRMPAIEQRLLLEGYLPAVAASPTDLQYNLQRLAAVENFQLQHGLQPDGIIGAGTLAEMNISAATRLDQLRINLERWRWIAPDLEPESLLVDIDGAQLSYFRDRQLLWKTRTQVGRAERRTPSIKSMLTRVTLNPTWTVPPTILKKDKLPAIRANPNFLADHQLRVLDYLGNELDPASIDWQRPGSILLRQDPGPNNPLGQLALRFPNPFSIYLHDTPSQALFNKAPRSFSSGCVRVEGIHQVLELLLTPAERQQVETLLASGRTVEYRLPRRVAILLAYWTAEGDAAGQPLYRPDIYGHDASLLAALNAATR